jgi:energy-coupling factor transport system ATP-binding protein
VGMVFQNPENQLFALSVEKDVAFGLENLGVPRRKSEKELIGRLNLREYMSCGSGHPQNFQADNSNA